MAQITIGISDELVQQLVNFDCNFSKLLAQFLTLIQPELTSSQLLREQDGLYQDILDVLINQPSLDQILHFKVSVNYQNRLASLLAKNQGFGLSSAESFELDLYKQLDTFVGLFKVRDCESLKTVHLPQA